MWVRLPFFRIKKVWMSRSRKKSHKDVVAAHNITLNYHVVIYIHGCMLQRMVNLVIWIGAFGIRLLSNNPFHLQFNGLSKLPENQLDDPSPAFRLFQNKSYGGWKSYIWIYMNVNKWIDIWYIYICNLVQKCQRSVFTKIHSIQKREKTWKSSSSKWRRW